MGRRSKRNMFLLNTIIISRNSLKVFFSYSVLVSRKSDTVTDYNIRYIERLLIHNKIKLVKLWFFVISLPIKKVSLLFSFLFDVKVRLYRESSTVKGVTGVDSWVTRVEIQLVAKIVSWMRIGTGQKGGSKGLREVSAPVKRWENVYRKVGG